MSPENLDTEVYEIVRELHNRRRIDVHIRCMIEEHFERLKKQDRIDEIEDLIKACRKSIYEVDLKDQNHIIKSNYIIFKEAINLCCK